MVLSSVSMLLLLYEISVDVFCCVNVRLVVLMFEKWI